MSVIVILSSHENLHSLGVVIESVLNLGVSMNALLIVSKVIQDLTSKLGMSGVILPFNHFGIPLWSQERPGIKIGWLHKDLVTHNLLFLKVVIANSSPRVTNNFRKWSTTNKMSGEKLSLKTICLLRTKRKDSILEIRNRILSFLLILCLLL